MRYIVPILLVKTSLNNFNFLDMLSYLRPRHASMHGVRIFNY